jgi:hypothetical protein
MTKADSKPVLIHEFTADQLTCPGEHILCAIIIGPGPDRDDPERKTLHMRCVAATLEILRVLPPETRQMIMEHQDRLLAEFRRQVLS